MWLFESRQSQCRNWHLPPLSNVNNALRNDSSPLRLVRSEWHSIYSHACTSYKIDTITADSYVRKQHWLHFDVVFRVEILIQFSIIISNSFHLSDCISGFYKKKLHWIKMFFKCLKFSWPEKYKATSEFFTKIENRKRKKKTNKHSCARRRGDVFFCFIVSTVDTIFTVQFDCFARWYLEL